MTALRHHAVVAAFLLGGLALSAVGLPATAADVIILSAYFLLLASSWNLLAGYTGQYSFAHVGLAAVGGYGAALVVFGLGLPLWSAFVLVPAATGLVGGALGLVALRVRGIQLPLITFAFAGAFAVWLSAASAITGGSMGMQLPRLFEGASPAPYLILAGVLCAIYFWLQNRILDGRLGLMMATVRDGEEVARGIGVDVYRVKVLVFMVTAMVAGAAGVFYAAYVGVLAPSMVTMGEMAMITAMAVIGGLGYRYGPLLGVVVIRLIEHVMRGLGAEYTLFLITGLALLVVMLFHEGLIAAAIKLWRRVRKPPKRWEDRTRVSAPHPNPKPPRAAP